MKLKYKIGLALIVICIGICFMISQSYALWTINATGGENVVSVGCFSITYTEVTSPISLNNTYPISDTKGLNGTPYTFTIKNNCTIASSYEVTLNTITTSTLTKDKIKYAIYKSTDTKPTTGINLATNTNYNTDTVSLGVTNLDQSIIVSTGKLEQNDEVTYNLYLWVDSTAGNEVMDKTFNASVNIISIAAPVTAVDTITKLAKTDTTNLAYDGTSDNNLRYIGATPNNYVSFNGELWRIIGVMNNIDNGSGTKETRLKIIRNESIGNYSWDSSDSTINSGWGVNEWSGADLMTELNSGPYWNRTSGTCYNGQSNSTATCDFSSIGLTSAAQAMIGTALWNTGSQGTNDYTKTATGLASNFYTYERSSDNGKICTSGDGCNDTVNRTTTWIGKIGLMYPSDYGYATAGGSITNRASCLAEPLDYWDAISDCRTNNWLYNASLMQWTLMPCVSSSVSSDVFRVYGEGHVYDSTAFTGDAVRPVGYLDSKTKIASGSGTSTDPYILSL